MKIASIAVAVPASLLAGAAYAGTQTLGVAAGAALPLAGVGLLGVAAVSLIAGIRMLRRKQDR
jgi:hypothetical protein